MNHNLEQITGKLRENRPELLQPEALTDRIMERIAEPDTYRLVAKPGGARERSLQLIRLSLSTAAALLLLILLSQTTLAEDKPYSTTSAEYSVDGIPDLPPDTKPSLSAYRMQLHQNVLSNQRFKQHIHPKKHQQ